MRIVSLNCSNTEIVDALGAGHLLVGVDDDSDWPPDLVDPLPKLGRDLDVRIDEVAALEPDLVLASLTVPGHEDVIAGLEQAGLPFLAPETQSLEDVYADVREIGRRIDRSEQAQVLVEQMQSAIEAPPEPTDSAPSILVQWWPNPVIAPGTRSWIHDMLGFAGARNPIGDRDVKSTPLTDEEVAELNPDAVVISWCGVPTEKYRLEVVRDNEAFRDTRFVMGDRVVPIAECFLGRPGPRLVEGSKLLRKLVRSVAD